MLKNLPAMQETQEVCIRSLGVGRIPWRRAWQPTPVFLPGESLEQRSLAGYSPWCCKESDMTERLRTNSTAKSLSAGNEHGLDEHLFGDLYPWSL